MFIFGAEFLRNVIFDHYILAGSSSIVRPHDGYSSRRALIKTDNPCMRARVVVDSIDVVSRLEATFICLVPHG